MTSISRSRSSTFPSIVNKGRRNSPRHPGVKRVCAMREQDNEDSSMDAESPLSTSLDESESKEREEGTDGYEQYRRKRRNTIDMTPTPCEKVQGESMVLRQSTVTSNRARGVYCVDEVDDDEEEEVSRRRVVTSGGIIKGPWTKAEDEQLLYRVSIFGPRRWSEIANFIPGRIGKQCRERWLNHLDPDVKKTEWNDEEDQILYEAQAVFGNKWSKIARLLEGRSENAVKNRWNSLSHRKSHSKQITFYSVKQNNSLLSSQAKLKQAKMICSEKKESNVSYEERPLTSSRLRSRAASSITSDSSSEEENHGEDCLLNGISASGSYNSNGSFVVGSGSSSQAVSFVNTATEGEDCFDADSFPDDFLLGLDSWKIDEVDEMNDGVFEVRPTFDLIRTPMAAFWNREQVLEPNACSALDLNAGRFEAGFFQDMDALLQHNPLGFDDDDSWMIGEEKNEEKVVEFAPKEEVKRGEGLLGGFGGKGKFAGVRTRSCRKPDIPNLVIPPSTAN